jgi:hypothetical protein
MKVGDQIYCEKLVDLPLGTKFIFPNSDAVYMTVRPISFAPIFSCELSDSRVLFIPISEYRGYVVKIKEIPCQK